MSLSRYSIRKADFPKAKKYLEGNAFKSKSPSWAVKNKQFLQIVEGKIRYNNLPIIPAEDVDSYLRGLVFDKKSRFLRNQFTVTTWI